MAYYQSDRAHARPPPPPANPYQQYSSAGTEDPVLRRTSSFNPGDDDTYGKGEAVDERYGYSQVEQRRDGRLHRGPSLAGRQEEELFMNSSPSTSQLPTRTYSQGPALSGYQHQYQPQSPPANQAPYNPQHYPRTQNQYAPQAYNNPTPTGAQQPYNPAAYQIQGVQRHPTYHGQSYGQSNYGQPGPGAYAPNTSPPQPQQSYFGRPHSQYGPPSRTSTYSSIPQSPPQGGVSPPLPPPPGSAPLPDRRSIYSPPAPPPPPFPPSNENPSNNYQANPARSSDFLLSQRRYDQSPLSDASPSGQPYLPSPPNYEDQGYFNSGSSRTNHPSISPPQSSSNPLPSPPAPTPPQHGPYRSDTVGRHPQSRPLPGPPTDAALNGDNDLRNGSRGRSRTEEDVAQENIWKEVEAAVMSPNSVTGNRQRSPRIEISHQSPIAEEEQPQPLFSNSPNRSPSSQGDAHSNGHLTATGTGQYVNYDAYDDESDAEAAAGLAAMREADEQEAADDARRESGVGPLFGSYVSPQRSQEQTLPAELSSDSDYANIDMGSYGGGYGGQLTYGRDPQSTMNASRSSGGFENASHHTPTGSYIHPSRNGILRAGNDRQGTYDYSIPDQDAIHPFPSFHGNARVDTFGTGGLSEPSPHGKKQDYAESDDISWERRSGSESPSKESIPEMFYHPGVHASRPDRPLPQVPPGSGSRVPQLTPDGVYQSNLQPQSYGRSEYPPAPDSYASHMLAPSGVVVPRSTSLSSHSSTPQTMAPVRSKTDAEERKARLLKQQYGTYSSGPGSDFGNDAGTPQSTVALDLPSIPAGKRKKFVPSKLSTADFKKCREPWALSSIAVWVREMSEDESDLKETTIVDGIVALFTHKVPTMNIADAETLSARVVREMFNAGALVQDEEWVKLGTQQVSGVMWQLTGSGCYAPRLHSHEVAGRCYSHHCSRTLKKINLQTHGLEPQRKLEDWATFFKLKKEDVVSASKKEVERQNILHEIVQTEDSYMDQLNVLRVLYRDQLVSWQPPLISQDRIHRFVTDVFGKVEAVKKVNEDFLLAQLKYRQQEQGPWIVGFSDLFREWIRKAKAAYLDYAANFPNAARIVRREKDKNLLFRQFLDYARDNERSKRLEWDTYLKAPITRLQRYSLLLFTVHKNMVQESEEKSNLQMAIDEIKAVTLECDARVAEASQKLFLVELGSKLILRPGMERVELNLDHLGRELIFKGDLQRTGGNRFTWLETHTILFDHYLVLAKTVQAREGPGGTKHELYDVSKLPIPMDLLVLESTNDDPVVKSAVKGIGAVTTVTSKAQTPTEARLGRNSISSTAGPGTLSHTNTNTSLNSISTTSSGKTLIGSSSTVSSGGKSMVTNTVLEGPKDEKIMYPFRVKHLGQDVYTLYAPSAANRQDWCDKILEAKTKHASSLFAQNAEPFRLRVVADTAFAYEAVASVPKGTTIRGTPLDRAVTEVEKLFEASGPRPGPVCRASVNCATAFTVARPYNPSAAKPNVNGGLDNPFQKRMVAVGTDFGVYISEVENPRGWSRAISATRVTQITVLEEFSLFLLIADRSLIAYHLDVVCPPNEAPPKNDSARRAPQKLSGNREVGFFATGRMKDRMLVFYKKRDGLSSTFKALEPVFQKSVEKKSRFSRKGATEFFREFDEFYIPSECFGINVFRSYLAISTVRGFEVLNLDKKQGWAVPDLKQPHVASIAARLTGQKPLGMFRLNDTEFLLCYEECAVYVNKHGDVSRSVIMEFVGKAKSAAMYEKYILLFDADFVEIRNADNGRLRQVIAGRDVRCLDDALAGDSAGRRTIKVAMQHPEIERTQLVVELMLNEGQQD